MNQESQLGRKCGSCPNFDYNGAEGEPVGEEISPDGSYIRKGLCRTPFGLLLGLLTERTNCKSHPEAIQIQPEDIIVQPHLEAA